LWKGDNKIKGRREISLSFLFLPPPLAFKRELKGEGFYFLPSSLEREGKVGENNAQT